MGSGEHRTNQLKSKICRGEERLNCVIDPGGRRG